MPKLYDVQVYKFPGVDTDTVTSSFRYAVERCDTLNQTFPKGHRHAIVIDFQGRPVHR